MATPIIVFSISIICTALFIGFLGYEQKRERRWGVRIRRRADEFTVQVAKTVQKLIPHSIHISRASFWHGVHHISLIVLALVRILDRHLVRFMERVRGKRVVVYKKASSSFIEEVVSHKKKLEKEREDRNGD